MCQLEKDVPDTSLAQTQGTATTPLPNNTPTGNSMGGLPGVPTDQGSLTAPAATKKVPTKLGTFLKLALPAVQGALYGVGTAEPTRAIGGGGFGPAFGGAFTREQQFQYGKGLTRFQLEQEQQQRALEIAKLQESIENTRALNENRMAREQDYQRNVESLINSRGQGEWGQPFEADDPENPGSRLLLEKNSRTGEIRPAQIGPVNTAQPQQQDTGLPLPAVAAAGTVDPHAPQVGNFTGARGSQAGATAAQLLAATPNTATPVRQATPMLPAVAAAQPSVGGLTRTKVPTAEQDKQRQAALEQQLVSGAIAPNDRTWLAGMQRAQKVTGLKPDVVAQAGPPPVPAEFPRGENDPAFRAANAAWGRQYDRIDNANLQTRTNITVNTRQSALNNNKYYKYADESGTHLVRGGQVPDGVDAVPVGTDKEAGSLITEARTANIIQRSLNQISQDVNEHPELFDNTTARNIMATTLEQIDRTSAGMLVAGTGGEIPLPSGLGDMINTQLQNRALDAKTATALKNYIADYKSMKDKVMSMQMAMQNGKMGRANAQAFKAIADQIPNGATADSATARRQVDNLQATQAELMKNYPEKYGDYTKEKPYVRGGRTTSPGGAGLPPAGAIIRDYTAVGGAR